MARLIPSFMDDVTPPGERDVFNMLAAGPDDWVVFHSLDLAPWNRGLRTEIDFAVVVPDAGILCLEVKSHDNIVYDGRCWFPKEIQRSPFKQAADGRYALHRRLSNLDVSFRKIPVVHGCIFPRSPFELHANLSVQPWELMDKRAFAGFKSGLSLCADLKARILKSIDVEKCVPGLEQPLSEAMVESLIRISGPVQRRRPEARIEIEKREEQVEEALCDQQRPVLQLTCHNDRVIVEGGAGTGKTLIAMEVARRAAERGLRVGLLCFNQLIGHWMTERVQKDNPPPGLVPGRAIQVLARMLEIHVPAKPDKEFWDSELPRLIEERLTDPDVAPVAKFDFLVVDEAQDILARPALWECLCQCLAGSSTNGRFALFGDFEHQVLSDRDAMKATYAELISVAHPARWTLTENCRNYRNVGDMALRLSGLSESVYTGYMRKGGDLRSYDIFFYEHQAAQTERIAKWLKDFKAEGYKPSEITLLSFRAFSRSAAGKLRNAGHKLLPVGANDDRTSYATVHAFKGRENKVIIVTDVLMEGEDFQRNLFYTAMTRATEAVRIACDLESREELMKTITERLPT